MDITSKAQLDVERALVERALVERAHEPAPRARSGTLDSFVEHLRLSYKVGDTLSEDAKLNCIRNSNAVYACATGRAKLLAGLPLRAYRVGRGPGRSVDLRDPLVRRGMPIHVRNVRLSGLESATEVDRGPLVALLNRPNADWTGRRLIQATEIGLCLVGQAHWRLFSGDAVGPPLATRWYKHKRLEPKRPGENSDGESVIAGWWLDRFTAQQKLLGRDEVVWLHYFDPNAPDYGSLSPLEAAWLGADSYTSAMKRNRDVFKQGLTAGAILMPPEDMGTFSDVQIDELERGISKKLMGESNHHTVAVTGDRWDIEKLSITPQEAEFTALLNYSVEDVARAYGWPVELLSSAGHTYENIQNALRAVWILTLEPEACWVAEELTEQLAPLFPDVDYLAFDLTDVVALQDDEAERWRRAKEQIELGAIVRNEWRAGANLDPLPWGDVAWLPMALQPVADAERAPAGDAQPLEEMVSDYLSRGDDEWAYGSERHTRELEQVDARQKLHIEGFERVVSDLFARQRDSLIDQLGPARDARISMQMLASMYNRARWIRVFRDAFLIEYRRIAETAGGVVFGDLDVDDVFDPTDPAIVNGLRQMSQKFSPPIVDTTWRRLKEDLEVGIREGESMRELAKRVDRVMGKRIKSSGMTIARTEVGRAYQWTGHKAAKQTGLKLRMKWLTAMDEKVRDSHMAVHGTVVGIDEMFVVGGSQGPAPGNLSGGDAAAQNLNCRCGVVYLKTKRITDESEIDYASIAGT